MSADQFLRVVLTAEAFAAVLMIGRFLGALWDLRRWPTRVIIVGVLLVLTYLFIGQIKAFYLVAESPGRIPFDGVSWFGIFAYLVLIVGLVAFERYERHKPPIVRGG